MMSDFVTRIFAMHLAGSTARLTFFVYRLLASDGPWDLFDTFTHAFGVGMLWTIYVDLGLHWLSMASVSPVQKARLTKRYKYALYSLTIMEYMNLLICLWILPSTYVMSAAGFSIATRTAILDGQIFFQM